MATSPIKNCLGDERMSAQTGGDGQGAVLGRPGRSEVLQSCSSELGPLMPLRALIKRLYKNLPVLGTFTTFGL